MNLAELLGGMAGPDEDDDQAAPPKPLPEAAVATLREVYERYAAGCPFKPGDLVTARQGANRQGAGDPAIVLEVRADPVCSFDIGDKPINSGSSSFGMRLDIRIARLAKGHLAAFWTESWTYEPYTLPDPAP